MSLNILFVLFVFFFICVNFFQFRAPNATITFQQLKRSLYRARLANLPPNVSTVTEINAAFLLEENKEKFGRTMSGNDFFKTAFSCANFSYCIFASDEIIGLFKERIPENQRHFLMDATFKIVPYGNFKQILIIYVSYLEQVIVLNNFSLNNLT